MMTKYTTTTQRSVILMLIGLVHPHERTDQERATELALMILAKGYFTHPICLDRQTMTLLDGHHRYGATRLLGFAYVPSVLVDYWSDDIRVGAWRDGETISRQDVLTAAKSGNLMPIKTSRHLFLHPIGECNVPLSSLCKSCTKSTTGLVDHPLIPRPPTGARQPR